jgi:hypothetical protein
MNAKNISKIIGIIIFGVILSSCKSSKEEGAVLEKKRLNPNVEERSREFADKGGGIFNSSRSSKSTTYDFASSNVLWRATLTTLEFMPLSLVDYSGGVISTDWYSAKIGSKESIKITVRFLSTDVTSSSVKVISHKKICEAVNECSINEISNNFGQEIKDKIFDEVRKISVANENTKK